MMNQGTQWKVLYAKLSVLQSLEAKKQFLPI